MTAVVIALVAIAPCAGNAPELSLIERAQAERRAGNLSKASFLAIQAVRGSGADVQASVVLHRAAQDIILASGNTQELLKHYDRILRKDMADPVKRYLRARIETDPEKRRRELESVFLTSSDLFWAAYDLAEAHALVGSWSRAVYYAEKAIDLDPNEAAAWNVLGHLRLESARLLSDAKRRRELGEKAKEAIEKAVELDPNSSDAHYNLGLIRYVLSDTPGATEAWREAVKLAPDHAAALNSLGHLAARDGRLDEAIALYEKAIAVRRDYGTAHNNLAVAYCRKEKYQLATKHMALAEAAGYSVAASFKRVLVRQIEAKAFVDFQKALARSQNRSVQVYLPGEQQPISLTDIDRRAIIMGILKAGFRDSHGGVSVAPSSTRSGGERKVNDTVVAKYSEAATLVLSLDSGTTIDLTAVLRESAATRKKALAKWFIDAGRRFSAESPDLAAVLSRKLGLPLLDE